MNYTKILLQGSAVFVIGAIIAAIFAYLTRIYLANSLSIENFGLFYAVLALILLLQFVRDLGLNQAAAKFIAEYNIKRQKGNVNAVVLSVFFFQMIVSIILVWILWMSADFLAQHYFKNENAIWLLKILSLYLPASTIFMNLYSCFQGLKKTSVGLIEPVKNILLLVMIFVLVPSLEIMAPAYAYVIMPFLLLLLFGASLNKQFGFLKNKVTNVKKIFKKVFFFGLPLAVTGMGATIISQLDTVMLTYFSTLEMVGIYSVILPTALVLMLFPNALGAFLMPIISELWAKKEFNKISLGMNILYTYSFTLVLPFFIALFIYAEIFLRIFFGEEFISGTIAFKILLIAILIRFFVGINSQFLVGIGRAKTIMKGMMIGLIVNIVLNAILIPRYGIEGAAIATGISYLPVTIYFMKEIGTVISLQLSKIPFLVISSVLFFLTVYFVKELLRLNVFIEIVLSLGLGLLVYFISTLLLKIVSLSEIKKELKNMRAK